MRCPKDPYGELDSLRLANEQVNLVEGINQPQLEKGYAVTDELNRITLYGEVQFPWQISFAPIYTFVSGVPADTFLPGTAINGASGSRLPLISRNSLGRDSKLADLESPHLRS
jgi:hypothetical protein